MTAKASRYPLDPKLLYILSNNYDLCKRSVEGKSAAQLLQAYLQGKVAPVPLENVVITGAGLGRGEIEAMALYKSAKADWLLLDDNRARKVARLNHIRITGSQGILLLAKHHGLIAQVRPYLERLRATDIRIGERLIERTLALAGE
jgi:predicted nucleic acid-binding protein